MSETLHLFEGYGIELEYMLVKEPDLKVYPVVDKLLERVAGEIVEDIDRGNIAWSNELVLHVLELKTNGPAASLNGLTQHFQQEIQYINSLLKDEHACLMPSGCHPLMNPEKETQLWPYGYKDVYHAYNRIFDCRGHGWSNLQSTHLNLPFANDGEFTRLHTAIRLLLPIMPALSASTPIIEGKISGLVDTRLQYYLTNQAAIPSITGLVIPESVLSIQEYQEQILEKIYRDIAPQDPEKILQFEWLNSRGAIARFDRNAIEIRILDIQECPQADLGIIALLVSTLKALVDEKWLSFSAQTHWSEQVLSQIWRAVIRDGQATVIDNTDYLKAFGLQAKIATAGELWQYIYTQVFGLYEQHESSLQQAIEHILEKGNLAERMLKAMGPAPSAENIQALCRRLSECLAQGQLFV